VDALSVLVLRLRRHANHSPEARECEEGLIWPESEVIMLNERFELRPGALVVGPEGGLGWIDALLAIPGSNQISGFVLREALLLDRGIRVPIEAVKRTEDSRVHVWLSAAQLNDLAHIQARRDARAIVPVEHRVEAGRRVAFDDGEAGSLTLVMVDPTSDQASHLVIRRGDLLGPETIVPMSWVRALTDNPILLDGSLQQLESLAEYRADEEITDVVSSLLWYRLQMHPDDLRHVKLQSRAGIVHLSGNTRTEQTRLEIEEHVRGMRGVLGVRNDLKTFEALGAAAQALRQRGGSMDLHGAGSASAPSLRLDDHRPGYDGRAGTDEVPFEFDAALATPLLVALARPSRVFSWSSRSTERSPGSSSHD
jgi:hypothetical protein